MTSNSLTLRRYRLQMHLTAAGLCVLFATLQYFAAFGRLTVVRRECESTLNNQQLNISQSDLLLSRLMKLQSEEDRLSETLTELRASIPDHGQEHSFMEAIACHAEESGLEIQEFRPSNPTHLDQFERVTLRISATSSWASLCQFLLRVNKMDRLCGVDECRISVVDRSQDQLTTNLSISIFSIPPRIFARRIEGDLH